MVASQAPLSMVILQARILEWGCLAFLQGIFPSQRWNPCLPHCRQILYQLCYQGSQSKSDLSFKARILFPMQMQKVFLFTSLIFRARKTFTSLSSPSLCPLIFIYQDHVTSTSLGGSLASVTGLPLSLDGNPGYGRWLHLKKSALSQSVRAKDRQGDE